MTKEFKDMWFKVENEEQFNELIGVLEGLGYSPFDSTDKDYLLCKRLRRVETYDDGEYTSNRNISIQPEYEVNTAQFIKEHTKEKETMLPEGITVCYKDAEGNVYNSLNEFYTQAIEDFCNECPLLVSGTAVNSYVLSCYLTEHKEQLLKLLSKS
jgi:hypothetical protein